MSGRAQWAILHEHVVVALAADTEFGPRTVCFEGPSIERQTYMRRPDFRLGLLVRLRSARCANPARVAPAAAAASSTRSKRTYRPGAS